MSKVYVPRERGAGERRVAATPETVKRLRKEGFEVAIEPGAGERAFFADAQYEAAGAAIQPIDSGWGSADVVACVGPPPDDLGQKLKENATLIGMLAPFRSDALVRALAERKVSAFALELLPRVTRAQVMDVLSSQASIVGYKAVLLAAARLPKIFPLMMTAAGAIQPARVVILGAGVAGLSAIAAARRLGGLVEVSDIRAAVKEEIESLGAKFIPLPKTDESGEGGGGYAKQMSEAFLEEQRAIVAERIVGADVVVTTALIPGRPAPRLVDASVVARMKPGSVIVDCAASEGGNCELTVPGEEVVKHGVTILGAKNLAAELPYDASQMFARNVQALLLHTGKGGKVAIDMTDEITSGTLLTHEGKIVHEPTRKRLQGDAA
jgi:H+-translocating NAD(P) transhydrogenase subunit alpha